MKHMSIKEKRPKSEYKMAFKAGLPQRIVSRNYTTLRVPKQKDPYSVKTYVIDSLAPLFHSRKRRDKIIRNTGGWQQCTSTLISLYMPENGHFCRQYSNSTCSIFSNFEYK